MWYNQHLIDTKPCKIIISKQIEGLALQVGDGLLLLLYNSWRLENRGESVEVIM